MDIHWQIDTAGGEELQLRTRPLRQQWEARGPGLLLGIERRARGLALAEEATVTPVLPKRGGGGEVFPATGSVTLEAVLTNPHADLPEIVRLGWLLTQLSVPADAANRPAWSLGLVPIVLSAAEEVELARCDSATIALAVEAWRLIEGDVPAQLPEQLLRWWSDFEADTMPLDEGVRSLRAFAE